MFSHIQTELIIFILKYIDFYDTKSYEIHYFIIDQTNSISYLKNMAEIVFNSSKTITCSNFKEHVYESHSNMFHFG